MVQGCQLGFPEPFNNRQHRGIDESNSIVRVLGLEIPGSAVIDLDQILNSISTRHDVIEEGEEVIGRQLGPAPVIELDNHRARHHERFTMVLDQLPAPVVIGIRAIDRCEQRSGV